MNDPRWGDVTRHPNETVSPKAPSRTPLWLRAALVTAVIVIVVLAAIVVAQLRDGESGAPDSRPAEPTSSLSGTAPRPSSAAPGQPKGSAMTCDGYNASVDESSQPGWHASINRFGLAYAAPPDWSVAACGVQSGWAKPCPSGQCVIRQFGAVSSVANPTCPSQNLAIAGVAGSNNPDIHAALAEEATTVSPIYTQGEKVPRVDLGPVREFLIGSRPAVQQVATVTDIASDACDGPTAFHSMVVTTVPGVSGSVVFLISLREGTAASPNPTVIDDMVRTLRSRS